MVNVFFEDIEILDLNPEFFVSWLNELCKQEQNSLGELSLIFCSDEYLLKVNQDYLQHDYYTDVITFDYSENDISGDLFISIERVKENAKKEAVEFIDELHRVVAHGTLHLLGYKDKSDGEAVLMRKKEEEALALIVSRET
ncbi:MAG: rRNA maturation RNase YbeY [Crocinitomicaceae bacterium]|nr:rRNA maturation RNase YbeY [Crocinitomicaceae bacterium]